MKFRKRLKLHPARVWCPKTRLEASIYYGCNQCLSLGNMTEKGVYCTFPTRKAVTREKDEAIAYVQF